MSPGPSFPSSILAFSISGQASLERSKFSLHSDSKSGCRAFCRGKRTTGEWTKTPGSKQTCHHGVFYNTTYNVVVSVETSHNVVPYVSFTKSRPTHLTQVQRFCVVCTRLHTFYDTAQAWMYIKWQIITIHTGHTHTHNTDSIYPKQGFVTADQWWVVVCSCCSNTPSGNWTGGFW